MGPLDAAIDLIKHIDLNRILARTGLIRPLDAAALRMAEHNYELAKRQSQGRPA